MKASSISLEQSRYQKNQSKAVVNRSNFRFSSFLLLIELTPDFHFKFPTPAEKSHPTNSTMKRMSKKPSLLRLNRHQNKKKELRRVRNKKDRKSKSRKKTNNNLL
jgi:hypothetical protein